MTFYNRKYLTAWLCLIAMWLIVFAPLVSQLVASHVRMNPSPRSVLPFNPVLQNITPAPTGVYTVSYFSPDPEQERTLYIDQYSDAVLRDIRYGDYGAASKAVSYSNSLHMGRYSGLANQVLCALISLGLAAMAVTGCVMWWKCRPARSLGAPGRERTAPPMRAWKAGLIFLGVLFPLMRASMLEVWIADRTFFGRTVLRVLPVIRR